MNREIEAALLKHVEALESGLTSTREECDRPLFIQHLAAAAGFFLELHRGDLAALRQRVDDERRSFGLSFLIGESGRVVEAAFHQFARAVETR